MRIQDEALYTKVYVADQAVALKDMFLGRIWMSFTNCQTNWSLGSYTVSINTRTLTGFEYGVQLSCLTSSFSFLPTIPRIDPTFPQTSSNVRRV